MVLKDIKIIVFDEEHPEKPQVLTIPRDEWNKSPVIHLTTATAAEHDKEPGIFVTAVKGTGGAIATGAKAGVTGLRKLGGLLVSGAHKVGEAAHGVKKAVTDAAEEYDQRAAAKKTEHMLVDACVSEVESNITEKLVKAANESNHT